MFDIFKPLDWFAKNRICKCHFFTKLMPDKVNYHFCVMNYKISMGTILSRLDVTPFNKVYLQDKLLPKNIIGRGIFSVILSPMC